MASKQIYLTESETDLLVSIMNVYHYVACAVLPSNDGRDLQLRRVEILRQRIEYSVACYNDPRIAQTPAIPNTNEITAEIPCSVCAATGKLYTVNVSSERNPTGHKPHWEICYACGGQGTRTGRGIPSVVE